MAEAEEERGAAPQSHSAAGTYGRLRTRNTKEAVNRGRRVESTASPGKRTAELKLGEKSCLTEINK
jgi:hypothetical protein